jgi:hypothetical protein
MAGSIVPLRVHPDLVSHRPEGVLAFQMVSLMRNALHRFTE